MAQYYRLSRPTDKGKKKTVLKYSLGDRPNKPEARKAMHDENFINLAYSVSKYVCKANHESLRLFSHEYWPKKLSPACDIKRLAPPSRAAPHHLPPH